MDNTEFSNEFDILYNSITSNLAPGLDEYEKSVFLTNGLNDIIRRYFNSRENKPQLGFDESRKRLMDFSALMKTATLQKSNTDVKFDNRSISYRIPRDLLIPVNEVCKDNKYRYVVIPLSYEEYDRLMLKPYLYPIKRGIWRLIVDSTSPEVASTDSPNITLSIVNSSLKRVKFLIVLSSKEFETVRENNIYLSRAGYGEAPKITETESEVLIVCTISSSITNTSYYWNTFLFVNNNTSRPWDDKIKLYAGDFSGTNGSIFPAVTPDAFGLSTITVTAEPATPFIELIGRTDEDSLVYTLRYLRRPRPIVLTNLEDGLSIQGVSTESSCELDESLHQEILQRAVELAKAAYSGDLLSLIALGQASLTDIGVLTQSR